MGKVLNTEGILDRLVFRLRIVQKFYSLKKDTMLLVGILRLAKPNNADPTKILEKNACARVTFLIKLQTWGLRLY